ncbi:hypothetical protein E5Q_03004 [Mixia osmundae IAM 14324]|uniref:DNA-directed RNA polymerase subunit n=1 Tax=Mixia osmundae (strain CBS 9802 / IAM 14324 / JCM 22182 / KY 12970) TaxID=764103 RepID=G7E0H8_MIXOS|nr:hypothetical protein E5Q_03004 [Mixia osmundae IAM 14324]
MQNAFTYSQAPIRRVRQIQFGILSPEETRALSVAKIDSPEIYQDVGLGAGSSVGGRPKAGGLADPRMGTIDRNFKCQTCGEGMAECPGHFGHIELGRPVYHVGFMTKVKKILECVCVQCGTLKSDLSELPLADAVRHTQNPKRRLKLVHEVAAKKRQCSRDAPDIQIIKDDDLTGLERRDEGRASRLAQEYYAGRHGGCGSIQPVIRKEGLKLFLVYDKSTTDDDGGKDKSQEKVPLSARRCLEILRSIPERDLDFMGLSKDEARPEYMILQILPVPPPPVRPSVSVDGGAMRSEDDLTYKLIEILRTNQQLVKLEAEGAGAHILDEFEQLLQWHIATYMDNDLPGQPQAMQKSGRAVKSIRARLKGKEGRLRGNLMGKRVDFSARTVITGDPNLELDEVGVPESIAKNLTYPERVTPYNITALQALVAKGPDELPGARYVVKDSGDRIDLRYLPSGTSIDLAYGWIVERHLRNGDYVLFNRQPSLHKMSMMAHRVKLLPYSTFRLNLSVTPPYNADFDGDEMNMHVPQSEETRAELQQIAWVPRQIVSPQANKPVMGIVQDTLCGIRKFTLRDCFMDRDFVQNIMLWVPEWDGLLPPPAIVKPKPMWTGKQILSMCIPRGVNLFIDNEAHSSLPDDDSGVLVDDGEIYYGVINKKTVGAQRESLVDLIFREKGPEICRLFFTGVQKVVNFWLLHNGFSIGIGDTVADRDTMRTITDYIQTAKDEVAVFISKAQQDLIEPEPGMTIRETFESKVTGSLNRARDTAGQSAERSLAASNNVKQMVVAGSKGSFINISQMSACVGQQIVEGKRIPFGFRYRSLPHFTKDDHTPEARGFVENSYLRGLTPQEFFFHAMAGREGLIDTAVKTAETGYIQRRLVKALEDVMVNYDGTVRNSLGDIVQFVYGEDGMDGASVERQVIEPIRQSDVGFERMYRVDITDPAWSFKPGTLQAGLLEADANLQDLLDEEYAQLQEDRALLRQFIFHNSTAQWPLPVKLFRIIQNAQQIFNINDREPSDLRPAYIIEAIRDLSEKLVIVRGSDNLTLEAQNNAVLLFRILLRCEMATKRVLHEHHLSREAFDWVVGEIEARFNASVVHPGEMCGTLAAQSIGEPATQMTLNTFHYAGVSSKNVTLGVPRLKEIINIADNIKTPSLTVYLQPGYARDQQRAKSVSNQLGHVTLRTITASAEIFYDPEPSRTVIEDDNDFVEAFFAIPDQEVEENLHRQSPWLLRYELDRAKVLDKGLTMAGIASKISAVFQSDLFVIWSEDTAEKLVIRCRTLQSEEKDDDDDADEQDEVAFLKRIETHMLDDVELGGIKGIQRVYMVDQKKQVITPAGTWGSEQEWTLETDGLNLRQVLTIDGVDARRTYSNSIVEVYNVLGIEAARAALLRELRLVIEFDGSYVNYRHLSLLCDLMTNRGRLMAITRHGINRADTGALMRCSFEETVEILMEAASVAEKDYCTGVAENVLLGQLAPMGTGAFDTMLDLEALKRVVVDHRLPAMNMMDEMFMHKTGRTPLQGQGHSTPYMDVGDGRTPMVDMSFDGLSGAGQFSPVNTGEVMLDGSMTAYGFGSGQTSPYSIGGPGDLNTSPQGAYSPTSPGYSPASPSYVPTSPNAMGATSPMFRTSPTSPWVNGALGNTSPAYSPTSPNHYSPASPNFSPASPRFSPSSPRFSPASPNFSPASPNYAPNGQRRASPTSPQFSPAGHRSPTGQRYSPTSPSYSPTSPAFSPTSPNGLYSPAASSRGSRKGSGASAAASASARKYSPTSPSYSPTSPAYSPTSPNAMSMASKISPTSPTSPRGPQQYSPGSPAMSSPTSPMHSPSSPRFSPSAGADRYAPAGAGRYSPQSGSPAEPHSSGQKRTAYSASPSWQQQWLPCTDQCETCQTSERRRPCNLARKMGVVASCCGCGGGGRGAGYEPLLLENEREAVADLLQYLENRAETNFFTGDPLRSLATLSFSENVDLQRSAALAFAEITEKDVREVSRDTLEPIMFLLQSHDVEVQRAASAALGNLAVNTDNKILIVKLGGLEPLIRQMLSPNVEVQCNAVGCITNLATHDENKTKIAKSGALVPLTRLARSKDMRVQRNATGALLNMTHSDENRQQLVNAGAIPVLVSLLSSPDTDVQYYCTTALSNIAVDGVNRRKLAQSEPKLVHNLIGLMDSPSLKVQCQAALALRNLASDEKYQIDIVKNRGLDALLRLLNSSFLPLILSAAACVRNVSIHPANESPIIEAGFLHPLIHLLAYDENEEIASHAISTLRNLAASSEKNKLAIVEAGAVERIKELVLNVPLSVQSEMTACAAVLGLSDDIKGQLLDMGICEVLIPLTASPSVEVQGNSAAAIGNLSSKADDYAAFNAVWTEPEGGLHGYLVRFLDSRDTTFQHIAVWTVVQLLESGDATLEHSIKSSSQLMALIQGLSTSASAAPSSAGGEPKPSDSVSQTGGSGDEDEEGGEGEIAALARRIIDLLDSPQA